VIIVVVVVVTIDPSDVTGSSVMVSLVVERVMVVGTMKPATCFL
jgi:hypothetical protein